MKSFLKFVILFTGSVSLLASCTKDQPEEPVEDDPVNMIIWDITPVYVVFDVTNSKGENLFDETTPDNWLTSSFSATFEGKEFFWPAPKSKAYLAILKGFYLEPYYMSNTPRRDYVLRLCFGELDGTKDWDADLSITWPDGSVDVISVFHTFKWTEDNDPDYYTKITVNGEPVEGRVVSLKK